MVNREIRFRAWDGNHWHYWGFNQGKFYAPPENIEQLISSQYTGLKDSKGKGIYEGDILKTSTGNDQVRWDDKDGLWCFDERCPVYFADINQREVIGNIYENPDLLANSHEGEGK